MSSPHEPRYGRHAAQEDAPQQRAHDASGPGMPDAGMPEPQEAVRSIPLSDPEQRTATSQQERSVGTLAREATTHLSSLIRSEVELAKAEIGDEVRKGLRGSVWFVLALSILVFSLFVGFIALAEVLDIWLPRSAAFGIVFGAMVVLAALLAFLGYLRVRTIRGPRRTISTVKESGAALTKRGGKERG